MRTVKSSTSREVAAMPHIGVGASQGGLYTERRAVDAKTTMLDRISRAQADVAVIGAGYVGLAVAREAAAVGFNVACLDIDAERIRSLNNGRSYVEDVSSEAIEALRKAGRLVASTEFNLLDRCDIAVIAVPTPLTASKEPDLSAVESAADEVGHHLRPGSLVVLESTTYPGTTTEVLQPLLESTGLKATALDTGVISEADYVVLLTRHECYDYQAVLQDAQLTLDTRNVYGFAGGTPDKLVRL